jgi:hypothetical protein
MSGKPRLRFSIRDLLWLIVVVALVVIWRIDHHRLAWQPTDDELWIPFYEEVDGNTLDELSCMLRDAGIPHVVRSHKLGGRRILVTLPHLRAAEDATADHPVIRRLKQPPKPIR